MRIFLDFDGVLRRKTSPASRLDRDCVEAFEAVVLPYAEARVVIASTWRFVHRLDALRKLFCPALAGRIEGVTPEVLDAEEYVRHVEVLAYLARKQLHGTRWVAIDDDTEQFREGAPLIHVDPAVGFDARCASQLTSWLDGR